MLSTYTATDDEDEDDPLLKWSLSGADAEMFSLCRGETVECSVSNSNTVSLRFKEAVDFEKPADSGRNNVYDVIVTATDSDMMSDTRRVAVTVTNAEEAGTVTLSNRQPEVDVAIRATLSDLDGGETGVTWKWEFSEVGETDCDSSSISEEDWSDLRAANSDTYTPVEDDATRCLRATATYTDRATSMDNPATTDMDESKDSQPMVSDFPVQAKPATNATPQFSDQDPDASGKQTVRYIEENSGARIGVVVNEGGMSPASPVTDDYVEADDVDAGDELTYSLSGRDESSFEINRETGQITVKEGTVLNYESKNTYAVIVTATDSSLASDSITVTIKVNDLNEAPVIMERGLNVSGPANVTHPERSNAVVGTYSATGPDSAGARLTLEGTDSSLFTLAGNGDLTFNNAPDFEAAVDQGGDNVYNVTVRATMGSLEDTQRVTITVENVDEDGTVNLSSPGNEVKVGVELTAELDEGDEEVVTGWQWASGASATGNFTNISGQTSNTYTPVEGDVGNYLQATVTYDDPLGSGKTLSAVTSDPVAPESTAGTPGALTLSPTTQLTSGDTVTATLTDADNPVVSSYVWQWERSADGSTNWTTISGATSASYETTVDDAGNYLRASVTYDDSSGTGQTAGPTATANRVRIDSYDANADGTIDGPEVLAAVAAYFRNEISPQRVLAVVALYFAGLS